MLTLEGVERAVSNFFPGPEVTTASLLKKKVRGDVIIFDIREREEYERSHIPNAIHLPPNTTVEEFKAKYDARLTGKKVVFYCAVGVRSAVMQERLQTPLASLGATAVYNLRGGIFRWFVNGQTVVQNSKPADEIHPYNESWGALLKRSVDPQA
jgi:rhodanese-related sulfurtransferase